MVIAVPWPTPFFHIRYFSSLLGWTNFAQSAHVCLCVCLCLLSICASTDDAQCSGLLDESFLGAKTVDMIGIQVLPCCCFVSVCICYLATDYKHTSTPAGLYFSCNCSYLFLFYCTETATQFQVIISSEDCFNGLFTVHGLR